MKRFADKLCQSLILDLDAGIVLLVQPEAQRPSLALGCAWDVTPVNIDVLSEQGCLDLARRHEHMIRTLPVGSAVQSLMLIRPAYALPAWEQLRTAQGQHPIVRAQQAAIATGLPHQDIANTD